MDFDTFSARAREIAASLPPEYLQGIEAVDVHRDLKRHPLLPDILTLGECETSPLSDPTGTDPFRSIVHLYHGSFVDLAREDPTFDVEAELRETIEHEIQHHLEDRAGIKDLLDEDALFEAHARFRAGMTVPAGWYRQGEELDKGLWAVDLDLFVELPLRRKDWTRLLGTKVELDVLGVPLEFEIPADADPSEVFTFEGEGLVEGDPDGDEDDEGEGDGDEAAEDGGDGPTYPSGDLHVVPVVHG